MGLIFFFPFLVGVFCGAGRGWIFVCFVKTSQHKGSVLFLFTELA